jgi:hypothetical protein
VDEDEDNNNYDEEFYDEEFDAQDGNSDIIQLQNTPSQRTMTPDVQSSVQLIVDQPETKSEKSAISESPQRLLSQPSSELTKKAAQEDIEAVETQKTPVKGPAIEGNMLKGEPQKDDEDNYGYDDFDDFED